MTITSTNPFVADSNLDRELVRAFLDNRAEAFALPEPNWGPIGKEVFERTYARNLDVFTETGELFGTRIESWAETVKRVVLGSLSYTSRDLWLDEEDLDLFDLIYNFRALPAGRHLWVTGTSASTFSKNCFASGFGARTSSHFTFLASRLLEGGGVGSNYSSDLLSVTQPITGTLRLLFALDESHADYKRVVAAAGERLNTRVPVGAGRIVVEDSREGWVDTWTRVIDLTAETIGKTTMVVDLNAVRPYGALLKTFGGTASGPDALVRSLMGITAVLNTAASSIPGARRLTGLEAMSMDHALAAAIQAGGARRSARMALMSWKDQDIFKFIHAKEDYQTHWTTNISVEIDDDFHVALFTTDHPLHERAEKVLHEVVTGMVRDGEPGMIDTSAMSRDEPTPIRITNPCSEASLVSYDIDGRIAGESCNLGSVDLDSFGTDIDGATEAFELMARFLYRATLNPHTDVLASAIENTNRRIGVGIMGLQGWCASFGVKLSELETSDELRAALTKFRTAVRISADSLADDLGTPHSVKVTAVAPTGTIAQLRGTQPGIHPVFARHFIRRVRYANVDLGLAPLIAAGHKVTDDIYAANTSVVEFVVRDSILDRHDESLIEQSDEIPAGAFFGVIATVQETFCGEGDGQSVSATAQIPRDASPVDLQSAIRSRLGSMKGFTVFPEVSRPLAPYEAISAAQYQAAVSAGLAQSSGDSNSGECIGGACPIR
jgi:ribonucleoside-triphosphate reductase